MTTDRDINHRGRWWLPDLPRKKRSGTLTIRPDGLPDLLLDRAWGHEVMERLEAQPEPVTILGETSAGKAVTLADGFFTSWTRVPREGKAEFHANIGFLGARLCDYREAPVAEVSVRVPALDNWLNISGFSLPLDLALDRLEVKYERPEPVLVPLDDDLTLCFKFSWRSPTLTRPQLELSVSQSARLTLRSSRGRSYSEITTNLHRIVDLLTLLIGTHVHQEPLRFQLKNSTRASTKSRPVRWIDALYSRTDGAASEKLPSHRDALVSFDSVRSKLGPMVVRWLDEYQWLAPALDYFFSTNRRDAPYREQRFVPLVTALEALHRLQGSFQPSPHLETKRQRIPGAIEDKKDRESPARRLNHAHEPPLADRLRALVDPVEKAFGDAEHCRELVKRIVKTRNQLVHPSAQPRPGTVAPERLLPYIGQGRALLWLQCLLIAGLSPGEVVEAVGRNFNFRQRHYLGKL